MKKINWSLYVINGVIAMLFGLLAIAVPRETIKTLALYFGLLVLAGGIFLLLLSIRNIKNKKPYSVQLVQAILAILIGLIIIFLPGETVQVFLVLIGIWAAIAGMTQIIVAVRMKGVIANHGLFTLNGIITLIFGLLLFFNPMAMAAFFMTLIGILALVAGILLVYLGFAVKRAEGLERRA